MNNERGSAQIALIIFIVLTLALSGTTYTLYMDKEQATKIAASNKKKLAQAGKLQKEKEGVIVDLTEKLEDVNKKYIDLNERYVDANRALTETRGERNDAFKARDEAEGLLDEEKSKFRSELQETEKQLTEKRAAIETIEEEMGNKEEVLEEKVADIKANAVDEVKKTKAILDDAQQEINQLKSRLAHVASDKEINYDKAEADGKIVFADPENKFVIINLTEGDGVIPNIPFDVYELGTAGNAIKKGKIRVKQVKSDVSYAVIEDLVNPLRPIISGDIIGNPVFTKDVDNKKTFVLDGEFSTYNNEEITTLIKDFGGKVDSEVTVKTDFIVVGLNPVTLREAKRLHIPLMKEEQLYNYIKKRSDK